MLTFDNYSSLKFLDLLEFPSVGLLYLLLFVGYFSLPLKRLLELDIKKQKEKETCGHCNKGMFENEVLAADKHTQTRQVSCQIFSTYVCLLLPKFDFEKCL